MYLLFSIELTFKHTLQIFICTYISSMNEVYFAKGL